MQRSSFLVGHEAVYECCALSIFRVYLQRMPHSYGWSTRKHESPKSDGLGQKFMHKQIEHFYWRTIESRHRQGEVAQNIYK